MAEPLFSPYWYRVENLHPRLVSTTVLTRQCFRGEQWYVLTNQSTGRQFRVDTLGYQILGRFDGRRTVQEIWDLLLRQLGAQAPTQDEVLSVLSELSAAGMIQSERTPDMAGIFDAAHRRRGGAGRKLNPIAFRVPLFDPTRLLDTLAPLARPLFRPWAFALWVLAIIASAVTAAMHWESLAAYAQLHLATPSNLLWMWLCYPLIKALHELGHALAIRTWHGDVNEVGITLFMLVPVPYVDASAASAFPEKHRRILVSAMGIMVETAVACAGLALWLTTSDGAIREIAFACMVIGGASTLLVNANPLMRFDGYYVLSDWLEMPGLGARAEAYLRYLGERYVLGNSALARPPATDQLRARLFVYGSASLIYRILLFASMVAWLAAKHIVAGALLALYLLVRFLVLPCWQLGKFVFTGPRLARRRWRAAGCYSIALIAGIAVTLWLPLPHATQAEGIVWPGEEARLRNETEGFVAEVLAQDGAQVVAGQAILRLENDALVAQREQLLAQIRSKQTAYHSALLGQTAQALSLAEEIERLGAQLSDTDHHLAQLWVVSPLAGTLALPRSEDLVGRYVERGSEIAFVVTPERLSVRAVLTQADIDLLRQTPRRIEVRVAEHRDAAMQAHMRAQTPAATRQLPSAVLGDRWGGRLTTDPADSEGLRTLESFFLVDLDLVGQPVKRIGGRAWIRIEHGSATLAEQWGRRLRQLFVKQFAAPAAHPVAAR